MPTHVIDDSQELSRKAAERVEAIGRYLQKYSKELVGDLDDGTFTLENGLRISIEIPYKGVSTVTVIRERAVVE